MYTRLLIRPMFSLTVLCAALGGPSAAASSCPDTDRTSMPDCAPVDLSNEDRNYNVNNNCDFKIMGVVTSSTGAEGTFYLEPGEVDFASLPEDMTVDSIRCCKAEQPHYFCTAKDAYVNRKK